MHLLLTALTLSPLAVMASKSPSPLSAEQLAKLSGQSVGAEACRVVSSRRLSSLWAGYGSIDSVTVAGMSIGEEEAHLVVKTVAPPKGNEGDVGHQRKVRSYEVEAAM